MNGCSSVCKEKIKTLPFEYAARYSFPLENCKCVYCNDSFDDFPIDVLSNFAPLSKILSVPVSLTSGICKPLKSSSE